MNFDIPWNFVEEQLLHNFMKFFSGPWANQIVNIWIVDHPTIFHFELHKTFMPLKNGWCWTLSIRMLLKLWHFQVIWHLFAGFKTVILCSAHSIWFTKCVLFGKVWFVETSTRIMKYEPQVVKLNPDLSVVHYGKDSLHFYIFLQSSYF